MRKVGSAPSLLNLGGLSQYPSSAQQTPGHCSSSHTAHRLKRESRAGENPSLPQVASSSTLERSSSWRKHTTRTQALQHVAPPPSLLDEADQLVLEAFQPRGLFGSGECLELYGNLTSAPDLRVGSDQDTNGKQKSNSAELGSLQDAGKDERLAECLATPFTGDDKNLGEIVDEEAREAMKQSQLRTQLRYAEETRVQEEMAARLAGIQEKSDVEEPFKNESPQPWQRRKRRASEDVYAYLQALGIHVEPSNTALSEDPASPSTKAALSSIFSSYDDASNTLHVDDIKQDLEDHYARAMRKAPATRFVNRSGTSSAPPLGHASSAPQTLRA